MSFITTLKDLILGSNKTASESTHHVQNTVSLTRQELLNALNVHFIQRLNEETTDEGLLFATNFVIYMNDGDYHAREQSFAHTVREAVNKFNRTIREKMKRYSSYEPHAQFWQFQFVPLQADNLVDGMNQATLSPKEVFILSSIYPLAENSGVSGAKDNERMVATVHDSKNSRTMGEWAVNTKSLKGITIQAKDQFKVDINNFADVTSEVKSEALEDIARAIIKITNAYFIINDRKEKAINMLTDYLQISGPGGKLTSGGMSVARIDNEQVMNEQITFHYNKDKHQLFMRAVGDVKLNEVPFDSYTQNDGYVQVPKNSKILINSNIQLDIIDVQK